MSTGLRFKMGGLTYKIIVFLAAFSTTTLLPLIARSHDHGWRYFQSSIKFQNQGTRFATAIQNAALGYDSTDLLASYVSGYSGSGVINYYEASRGASFPVAAAVPWSGSSTACATLSSTGSVSTGLCNTTTKKVTHGQVYLNSDYGSIISAHADHIMKHEAGHILGMAHGPCGEVSVMIPSSQGCGTAYGTLQTHDITLMNNWY
jgi:hypothetical protein